jgi:hypothetical protein
LSVANRRRCDGLAGNIPVLIVQYEDNQAGATFAVEPRGQARLVESTRFRFGFSIARAKSSRAFDASYRSD